MGSPRFRPAKPARQTKVVEAEVVDDEDEDAPNPEPLLAAILLAMTCPSCGASGLLPDGRPCTCRQFGYSLANEVLKDYGLA